MVKWYGWRTIVGGTSVESVNQIAQATYFGMYLYDVWYTNNITYVIVCTDRSKHYDVILIPFKWIIFNQLIMAINNVIKAYTHNGTTKWT